MHHEIAVPKPSFWHAGGSKWFGRAAMWQMPPEKGFRYPAYSLQAQAFGSRIA